MNLTRRQFLGTAGAAGVLAATGGWRYSARASQLVVPPPAPDKSGIEHIVVVMMENRSFDHFLGWMPGADGRQAGLTFRDAQGRAHSTYSLSGEYSGCAHPDPDHSYEGGRAQYDQGKMDGWLHKGSGDDTFALGYYGASDRPFMSRLALNYTTLDRYFCSILAETYPNRFFMHGATTDRLHNSTATASFPTIWDRLQARGVSARYYFSDLPFLALWGSKYVSLAAHYTQFLADAAAGTLPAVSFVDPRFETETAPADIPGAPNDTGGGTSGDDHPHGDIRAGDAFLGQVYKALTSGPNWANTVLVINYDEWGGFFDHVAPPRAAASAKVDKDLVGGRSLLGFRVPCIIASPFTKGRPSSPRIYGSPQGQQVPFDHTSVLKLIEWRYGLAPLTARDATPASHGVVGNVLDVFDFRHPDSSVPSDIPFPAPPPPDPCGANNPFPVSGSEDTWGALRRSGLVEGWDAA